MIMNEKVSEQMRAAMAGPVGRELKDLLDKKASAVSSALVNELDVSKVRMLQGRAQMIRELSKILLPPSK